MSVSGTATDNGHNKAEDRESEEQVYSLKLKSGEESEK